MGEILKHVLPQDFVKFGMIPEIIGRVPVVVSLDALDKETTYAYPSGTEKLYNQAVQEAV